MRCLHIFVATLKAAKKRCRRRSPGAPHSAPPQCTAPGPKSSPGTTRAAGAVPLLAPLPALLVALLFALAAVRRSPQLHLAGLLLGGLYVVAGLLVSLVGTFG